MPIGRYPATLTGLFGGAMVVESMGILPTGKRKSVLPSFFTGPLVKELKDEFVAVAPARKVKKFG